MYKIKYVLIKHFVLKKILDISIRHYYHWILFQMDNKCKERVHKMNGHILPFGCVAVLCRWACNINVKVVIKGYRNTFNLKM